MNTEHDHDHGSAPQFLPHWMQERWTLLTVVVAGLALAVGFFGEKFFGLPPSVALAFYLLAYLAGGYDVAREALPALFRGKFDIDILMIAAAMGAALLGEWTEGAFLLFLFSLGHAGEHYAMDRARHAVGILGELMPRTAFAKRGDRLEEVPVEQIAVDEIVVVKPGERVPVDGVIVAGESSIDQSAITGESVPVGRKPGDEVFAGTINQDNALDVRMTRLARDNTLARVMQLVAEAQEQKSPDATVHGDICPPLCSGGARWYAFGHRAAAARVRLDVECEFLSGNVIVSGRFAMCAGHRHARRRARGNRPGGPARCADQRRDTPGKPRTTKHGGTR